MAGRLDNDLIVLRGCVEAKQLRQVSLKHSLEPDVEEVGEICVLHRVVIGWVCYQRIRCVIDVVGISNFVTFLENTKDYRRDLRRVEYGDERDPAMREHLLAISPTTRAGEIRVPLLVAQGANDPRVPASEAEQIVEAARGGGQPVWYLLAKDEGHGFRKKGNRDYFNHVMILFLEQHLLGELAEQPAPEG